MVDVGNRRREPKGIPTGGRFADENGGGLDASDLEAEDTAAVVEDLPDGSTRVSHPGDPTITFVPRARQEGFDRPGEDKGKAGLNLRLVGFTDAKHFDPNGMIALYDKGSGGLAAGWSYLKLLEHWQRKHNRAAYVPYLREGSGDGTTVEFGPLVTLGISTGFGLFLQAFRDGKVVYNPGDKAILRNGRWTPHSRSQFRINLNDIAAIYQQVRRVDVRDFRERP